MSEPVHVPVLVDRVVALLGPALTVDAIRGTPVVVDATVGLGGHAEAILRRFPPVRLLGLDRDPDALAASGYGSLRTTIGSPSSTPSTTSCG